MGDKGKKKLTKKELKAQNHARLMSGKGSAPAAGHSNVVDINAYKKDQELKKAS
ncbi:MAG TPA: hypothetical protein VNJ08_17855 [Bacteriovoracaceae bacterium]|nr:hypothetical protein [Bacteriovoracaceae bacterium]